MDRMRNGIVRRAVCAAIILCCTTVLWSVEFAGGTGKPNDPYQIATAGQLIAIGSDPNLLGRHYILLKDIDLDPSLPGGRVFDEAVIAAQGPSRGVDPNFTGSLDGKGFKVRNLTIEVHAGSAAAVGLFGRIGADARITNFAVDNARIQGSSGDIAVGALVGINSGHVEACYATGSVAGSDKVGGLCGENRGAIRSCYAAASVSGQRFAGGLIGWSGGISSRTARRDVAANAVNQEQVINCYATGMVSAFSNVGGLIGGGIGVVQACFWDVQTSGQETSAAGTGLPTSQMREAVVFATSGWDQDANWVIDDGRDYPRLAWEGTAGGPIRGKISDHFEGAGTPQDPYHIVTVEQFALIGIMPTLWDKHFVLDADLDLAGILLRPIGVGSWQAFSGFFHGNRHILRHFTPEIDAPLPPTYGSYGLFGYVGPGGRISRLGLEDVAIVVNSGSPIIGALTAVNEGVVTGCYATGAVHAGQGQPVIGLVGHNRGVLARSYAKLNVTGLNWTGGLVARNYSPSSPGSTSLPARPTYSGLVLECYADLNVPKGNAASGLIGTNEGLVLNSYFLTEPDEEPSDGPARRPMPPAPSKPPVGTPLTDSQMRQQSSFVGWDFVGSPSDGSVDRWHMSDGNYPVLSWQADLQGSCPVPDIADLPLDWARTEIESAGFIVGEILYDYHSAIPKDRAIVSSPVGIAPLGSTVNIVASRGVYTLPNFTSYKSSVLVPSLVELETPGQIECLAGRIFGGPVIMLTRDIDMSGWDVLSIPTSSSTILLAGGTFNGVLLGENHRISHLRTYRGTGLFDRIAADGFVQELRLEDILMLGSGDTSAGGLAVVNDGVVLRCAVTGVVLGSENTLDLGGLVGTNSGIIESCRVDAAVHGSPYEAMAEVSNVGGMVGLNWPGGRLTACYVLGSVSGLENLGGLLGENHGSVAQCYAVVAVTGQGQEHVGGLVGNNAAVGGSPRGPAVSVVHAPVTSCYLLSPADDGGPDNGWGTPLTLTQMQRQASFIGWDFEDTWTICEGRDYPRLRWEHVECSE